MALHSRIGRRPRGFTLIAVLAATTLLGLASHAVMQSIALGAQRQRELRLLQAGDAFVQAIGSYYADSPGQVKEFPGRLDDLLEDPRFVSIKRHLRELYADPMAGGEWELLRAPDGGIAGVASRSTATPLRTAAFRWKGVNLPGSNCYCEWKFVFTPPDGRTRGRST